MSPAWEKITLEFPGALEQSLVNLQNLSPPAQRRVQAKQPQIQRHLIISTPARMKPTSCFTYNLLQAMLNVHMDVFQLIPIGELARLDLLLDLLEALKDSFFILRAHNPLSRQHAHMSSTALKIVRSQSPVQMNRTSVFQDNRIQL